MTIPLRAGDGPRFRSPGTEDSGLVLDLSGIDGEGDVVNGVFTVPGGPSPQIEDLTPSIAVSGLGGSITKLSAGVARFMVTSRGIRVPVSIAIGVVEEPEPDPGQAPVIGDIETESPAAIRALLTGLPGGAVNMELWTTFDPVNKVYVRNTSMWAHTLRSQLAACVAYKDTSLARQSYGGVLISPRHVLYCEHAHPFAEGTWINPIGPTELHWVLADNTSVTAIQIAQSSHNPSLPGYYSGYMPGVSQDACVAVLDRDVEALGVPVMPIVGMPTAQDYTDLLYNAVIPRITVTQGYERITSKIPPTPISDYPQYNNAMVAVATSPSPEYQLFDYAVWDGDSGTPSLILHDGTLYLSRLVSGIPSPGLHISELNAKLLAAENDAVARGKMGGLTGITLAPTLLT